MTPKVHGTLCLAGDHKEPKVALIHEVTSLIICTIAQRMSILTTVSLNDIVRTIVYCAEIIADF